MSLVRKHLLSTSILMVAACAPAVAGVLVGSSAAGGSSASSAASDSVGNSSDSATRAVANLDGAYRIVDVTPVPERPGTVRVTLRTLAATEQDETALLYVPQQAFERAGLAPGGTITAQQRPYGVEFAHADTRRAFFLLLNDGVQRELRSNPVSL